jgi:hypothetical protein
LIAEARNDSLFGQHFMYTELVVRLTRSLNRDNSKAERIETIPIDAKGDL